MIHNSKSKLLIIIGPTSSGKSGLAVVLAKKFNGEIVSCDSRQIYKAMGLGTGKVAGKWLKSNTCLNRGRGFNEYFIYKGIVHHLIDLINPKKQYSAALFQRDAKKIIADIIARGKLPILCGGTAHWIDAVIYDQQLPDVKPDARLRRQLGRLSAECLFARISRLDSQRAKTIDRHNKRRLIRALEIVILSGKPVPPFGGIPSERSKSRGPYDTLWLGLNPPQNILFAEIKKRLKQRLNAGMIKEVKQLHRHGLSYKRLKSFGLEYKFVSLYLQKRLSYDKMFEQLFTAIKQYSKRQMTWWKKNKDIRWIKNEQRIEKIVKNFLK